MSEVVFILGAGASREAGGPLMHDFLDIADGLWKSGEVKNHEDSFEAVMKGIGALQTVHSKSELDLRNLESVFATFDMAQVLGKFPGHDPSQIDHLISSFKTLIAKTLSRKIEFPKVSSHFVPPPPYETFAELLHYSQNNLIPSRSVSVITFNYDMAIDYSLYYKRLSPNYYFNEKDGGGIPLLKLHGSLNWAKCSQCNQIVAWDLKDFFKKYKWDPYYITDSAYMTIEDKLTDLSHCNHKVLPDPILVPPTWNKHQHQNSLSKVWAKASQELSEAEYIFVIGYSLPDSDQFFRYLYALGSVGSKPLKAFWVFDPDLSNGVETRFRNILGPGAKDRFEYFRKNFNSAIGTIESKISEGRKIITI